MGLPLRMNLTTVRIKRLWVGSPGTQSSSVFKGATSEKVYHDEEDFRAQLYLRSQERRNRQLLGDNPFTMGHLTYRSPSDLTKRLKKGDLVVGLPNGVRGSYDTVNYEVSENCQEGHLPGPLIYCAYFGRNEDVTNSP